MPFSPLHFSSLSFFVYALFPSYIFSTTRFFYVHERGDFFIYLRGGLRPGAPPRRWKWGGRDQAAAKPWFSSEGNSYQKPKTQRIWPTIFLKMGIIPRTLKKWGTRLPLPLCGEAPVCALSRLSVAVSYTYAVGRESRPSATSIPPAIVWLWPVSSLAAGDWTGRLKSRVIWPGVGPGCLRARCRAAACFLCDCAVLPKLQYSLQWWQRCWSAESAAPAA